MPLFLAVDDAEIVYPRREIALRAGGRLEQARHVVGVNTTPDNGGRTHDRFHVHADRMLGESTDERKGFLSVGGTGILIHDARHHRRDLFEPLIASPQLAFRHDDVRDIGNAEDDRFDHAVLVKQRRAVDRQEFASAVGPFDAVTHIEHGLSCTQHLRERLLLSRPRPSVQVGMMPLRRIEPATLHLARPQAQHVFRARIPKDDSLGDIDHDHTRDARGENPLQQVALGTLPDMKSLCRRVQLLHPHQRSGKSRFALKRA